MNIIRKINPNIIWPQQALTYLIESQITILKQISVEHDKYGYLKNYLYKRIVCSGFEPGNAEWQAQMNPLKLVKLFKC